VVVGNLDPDPTLTAKGRAASELQVEAKVVVGNLDPFRLRELVGAQRFGTDLNQRLDAMRRDGTTMKARALPRAQAACTEPARACA